MIIEKKKPLFGRFGDFTPGIVFCDYYEGDVRETYMKMQEVLVCNDGHSQVICNAVNIESGEWTFFDDDESIVPYINARITLE